MLARKYNPSGMVAVPRSLRRHTPEQLEDREKLYEIQLKLYSQYHSSTGKYNNPNRGEFPRAHKKYNQHTGRATTPAVYKTYLVQCTSYIDQQQYAQDHQFTLGSLGQLTPAHISRGNRSFGTSNCCEKSCSSHVSQMEISGK